MDAAGEVKYMNPAARAAFPELQANGSSHELLADWDALVASVRSARRRVFSREVRVGERWYEQVMTTVPSARTFRVYARDITDRKKAEQALRESETRYRNVVETGNEGIWVTDAEYRAVLVNRRMAEFLGYTVVPARKVYGACSRDRPMSGLGWTGRFVRLASRLFRGGKEAGRSTAVS